jgi:hypothetical protein
VYRNPEQDECGRFGFGYRRVDRYLAGDAIAPQAFRGASHRGRRSAAVNISRQLSAMPAQTDGRAR